MKPDAVPSDICRDVEETASKLQATLHSSFKNIKFCIKLTTIEIHFIDDLLFDRSPEPSRFGFDVRTKKITSDISPVPSKGGKKLQRGDSAPLPSGQGPVPAVVTSCHSDLHRPPPPRIAASPAAVLQL